MECKEETMENKIILQNGSGAFLRNGNRYLLMKRSPDRIFAPNKWSCIGGKFIEEELNDPLKACYREIKEETGIKKEHISYLKLRYIIIRRAENIIRQNYLYFGETDIIEFKNTKEGSLHWIEEENLIEKEFTETFKEMIKHFLENKSNDKIIVGVAGKDKNRLKMEWNVLEDFE